MNKIRVISALSLFVLGACSDDPTEVCVGPCAEADVIVETTVRELDGRPAMQPFMPGTRYVVTWAVKNRHDVALDTVWLTTFEPAPGTVFYGEQRRLTLPPRGAVEVSDTFTVPRYTFGDSLALRVKVQNAQFENIKVYRRGDAAVRTRSSGYDFDIAAVPNQAAGDTLRIRQLEESGALLLVRNPYELPLDSLRFNVCIFDIDYCAASDTSGYVPRLEPAAETYFDLIFTIDGTLRWHWWERAVSNFVLCGALDSRLERCTARPVILLANLEAACDVQDITPGTDVSDAVAECPKVWGAGVGEGSAYRFQAQAGERYRVAGGWGFIVPEGGVVLYGGTPGPEYEVRQTGTHYVVVLHRQPVTFRLERIED